MDANVQESTAKAEKLSIGPETPEYSTNWCDIPMEMRSECIQRMDLKTRMRLRRTSKTEKWLVEWTRCHLKHFKLEFSYKPSQRYSEYLLMTIEKNWSIKVMVDSGKDTQNFLKFLIYILTHHEIDVFAFVNEAHLDLDFESMFPELTPFRFKTFRSAVVDLPYLKFFLNNCKGVENVCIEYNDEEIVELIDCPAVIKAKIFQVDLMQRKERPFKLVQKWIDNDAEVGKKLRFARFNANDEDNTLEQFASIFKDRVISKDEEKVRIRTDNPAKHIILSFHEYDEMLYFSCDIISSDLLAPLENWEWAYENFWTTSSNYPYTTEPEDDVIVLE